MSYDNTNRGALFKNDKGNNPKRPDYRGPLDVDGKEMELSAWISKSQSGETYMSLKVQPKRKRESREELERIAQGGRTVEDEKPDFDDDIPF